MLNQGNITLTIGSNPGDGNRGSLAALLITGVSATAPDPRLATLSTVSKVLNPSDTLTVAITNIGEEETLSLSEAVLSGPDAAKFTIQESLDSLLPGESGVITLAFEADGAVGNVAATLTLPSNDPVAPSQTVQITGTVYDPHFEWSGTGANFGELESPADAIPAVYTLTNSGASGPLTFSQIAIEGVNASGFTFTSPPPTTLEPGATAEVEINFVGTLPGSYYATLVLASNDPVFPSVNIPLEAQLSNPNYSVGLNFTNGYSNPRVEGKTVYGFTNWFDLGPDLDQPDNPGAFILDGTVTVDDHLTVSWNASNGYDAGLENVPDQQVYRVYLDDWDNDTSYEENDGIGVSVQLSGLAAWLNAHSAQAYTITAYRSTDSSSQFHDVSIRRGLPQDGQPLAELPEIGVIGTSIYGTNSFPVDDSNPNGTRGWGVSAPLTEDAVTLTLPVNSPGLRGTLAALSISVATLPPVTTDIAITAFSFDAATGVLSLTWTSAGGEAFTVQQSTTLQEGSWSPLPSGNVTGAAGSTTWTGTVATPATGPLFFRVIK